MAERPAPSMLAITAAIVAVGGLAMHPRATVAVLALAAAAAFAGARRVALVLIVVLTLAGVAGVRVDAAHRGLAAATEHAR